MKKPLTILIAPDSMKESLDSFSVAEAIASGIRRVNSEVAIIQLPMADGGEGTVSVLVNATKGIFRKTRVHDPLMRLVEAEYGILGDGKTAVIEVASASGLTLLNKEDRNPLVTSSFGTGELILNALNSGCRSFIIGLGGSATNDGGVGLMRALGLKVYDQNKKLLSDGGASLISASIIDDSGLDPRLQECDFLIACDVQNPLTGANGASHVFGPQKGATPEMVQKLEQGLTRYADLIYALTSKEVAILPGAGAAGGIAASLFAFCNATMQSGFDLIAEKSLLEKQIQKADLIITAEGKTDGQTLQGKVPYGVLRIATKHNVPVIIMAGTIDEGSEQLYQYGANAIVSIIDKPMTIEEAMKNAYSLIENASERIMRLIIM